MHPSSRRPGVVSPLPIQHDGGGVSRYRLAIGGIVLVAALVGITALVCAPNTWDAMEYHLPRVFEWINNHSVGLYPTIDRQQLGMPPWSEYAMLHLDLLYGGDRLVNLVQWSAYVGSILTASLIAEELGGDRDAQVFAAVLCATIPSAVLGASGAKNDCVLAYWIILSTYLLLTWRREQNWPQTVGLGCALTLCIFTKGTGYAFLPCIVIACALTWSAAERRRFAINLPILAAICLVVAAPFWLRNYAFSGSIFGMPYFEGSGPVLSRMFNPSPITLAGTAANVIRNAAVHLGVPSGSVNAWSSRTLSAVIKGIGVDPNDPGQLYASQLGHIPPFGVNFAWRTEVLAGDDFHFLGFCAALVLCFAAYRKIGRRVTLVGLAIVTSFILYCALVRWSPWNARYHLPLLALAAPFTAIVVARTLSPLVTRSAAAVLLLWALPLAADNDTRPLITRHLLSTSILTMPREQQYFLDQHRELAASFIEAARYAAGQSCRSIGLDATLLRFEYPMLALLSRDGIPRRITYSSVQNPTTQYASATEPPHCLIVCLGCVHAPEKWREYAVPIEQGRSFGDFVAVLAPPVGASKPDR